MAIQGQITRVDERPFSAALQEWKNRRHSGPRYGKEATGALALSLCIPPRLGENLDSNFAYAAGIGPCWK